MARRIKRETKEELIKKLAYPQIIFDHEMKWIDHEIKDLLLCREFWDLDYATIAVNVVHNYKKMKENLGKDLQELLK